MEETLQQEKQELEYKNPNEDEGGIRRRLRDRDLLRKRKAEAEEKETNQVESQRKRSRADERSGTKKRGRPRKTGPVPEISVIQEEAAIAQETPSVVVVPEPMGVILDQTLGSLTPLLAVDSDTLESQPASVLAASIPEVGSVQSSVLAPFLTSPVPVNQTPALVLPSAPDKSPASVLDTAPIPFQDSAPAPATAPDAVPVPALSQAPVPFAGPAPPQMKTLYTESQGREALDQVLIEDLGPDEEEDISPSQEQGGDEDLSETPSINVPEQNKMLSIPTLSSPPPPQEYLPGN
ncbi:helicase SRCAP isoform X2 [Xiphias gladius]|uniref:helicase SRCAP isoform X2 n=1 Tax=Xiphias gladius TaxID=8245 RepID=UPI001A98D3C1|nr:helicase SRCAP isoform X2 [Xiphias gladius]